MGTWRHVTDGPEEALEGYAAIKDFFFKSTLSSISDLTEEFFCTQKTYFQSEKNDFQWFC